MSRSDIAGATRRDSVPQGIRWFWLFLLVVAPVVLTALRYDIGAFAYDAATEHIYRGVVFSEAISDGVLYPRWIQPLHWGLGSPLFTFQPPLPYYGLDVLSRLGVSHPIGWRLMMALGFLVAGLGGYLLVHELTGRRWPALVAAIGFVYAPYVLRNALERGSNEAFSMFLYPLVLWGLLWVAWRPTLSPCHHVTVSPDQWGLLWVVRRPAAGRFLVATLVWAACIASHVLGPLMLAPFASGLALLLAWRKRTLAPLAVLLAGGLLTAGIWLPMSPEQQFVHVERDFTQPEAIPAQNPIPLDRLLALPAVYDTVRDNNSVGDRIGLVQTVLLILGLPATAYAWRRQRRVAWAAIAATLMGLLVFWLLTGASDWLWRAVPALGRLLYRTRLMGAQALAAAIVGGLLVAVIVPRWQPRVGAVLAGLLVIVALPTLYVDLQHRYATFELPVDLAQVRAAEIRTGGTALTAFGEFTPRWRTAPFDDALLRELGPDFDPQTRPLANPPSGLRVEDSRVRTGAWTLDVAASEPATLTLHLLYYPRWAARVDGQAAILAAEPGTGYAQVRVPEGTHRLDLRYERTPAERVGLGVSTVTLLGLGALGVRALLRKRRAAPLASLRARANQPDEPPQSVPIAHDEPSPPAWLLAGLSAVLVLKFVYIDPATTWLRCTSTPEQVCGAQASADIAFAGAPRLRGYAVASAEVRRGDEVRVDLFWQGEASTTRPLSSFVHIRNSRKDQFPSSRSGGDIWAQSEHVAPGGLLTNEYLPDKLYRDEFRVRIPVDMPPDEYFLEVGWFDPASGEQLDPQPDTMKPPLRILWRSILLPSVQVR